MLSRAESLIRLSQIFEESGMHSVADIIDGRIFRIAQDRGLEYDTEAQPNSEQDGKSSLMAAWIKTFPLKPLEEKVAHTEGELSKQTQSFWVLPNGSRIELGITPHGPAFSKVLKTHNLEEHPDILQMQEKHNKDYYNIMGDYYDAVRVFIFWVMDYPGELTVDVYQLPTPEQIQAIKNIKQGYSIGVVDIYQVLSKEYFSSIESWEQAVESQRPPKTISELDQELNVHNRALPVWKTTEIKNLEERYPGPENKRFRDMYQRSADKRVD